MSQARERPPAGGWLGPCTTGWPDLPERDLPGHLRPGATPKDKRKGTA